MTQRRAAGADDARARIRKLNDQLRRTGRGGDIFITQTVHKSLTQRELLEVIVALQGFNDFTPDNDPHGEHDCALFEDLGRRFLWKIDYYDRDGAGHSPDPADPSVTRRVLTLMFADDY